MKNNKLGGCGAFVGPRLECSCVAFKQGDSKEVCECRHNTAMHLNEAPNDEPN